MGALGLDGHTGVPAREAQPAKLQGFILKLCVSGGGGKCQLSRAATKEPHKQG